MQTIEKIGLKCLRKIKYSRLKKLENQLSELKDCLIGETIVCPICNYVAKNKRGTAKIYPYGKGKSLKCFCCGVWRKIS